METNQTSGTIFKTLSGFLAKPEGVSVSKARQFPNRGEAVRYLHRVARLQERVGR